MENVVADLQVQEAGMGSKFDIGRLRTIVHIIVRKRFHPGHARLNFDDLIGEGYMLIAKLIKENPNHPQGLMEALLRRSFENRIIDLRRDYCLRRTRGAKTVQMSKLMESGTWEPAEDEAVIGSSDFRLHKVLDSVLDVKELIRKIELKLTIDERRVFRALVLRELNESDIVRNLNMTRHHVRKALWKIKGVTRQVLKESN